MRHEIERRFLGPPNLGHRTRPRFTAQHAKQGPERLRCRHHPRSLAGDPRFIAADGEEVAVGAVGGVIGRQKRALPGNVGELPHELRAGGELVCRPFEPPPLARAGGKEIAKPLDLAPRHRTLWVGKPRAQHHHIQAVLELAAAGKGIFVGHRWKPKPAAALVVPERIGLPALGPADVDPIDPPPQPDRLARRKRHLHRRVAIELRALPRRLDADRGLERQWPAARLAAGPLLVVEKRVHRRAQLVAPGVEGERRERRRAPPARLELLVEDREQVVEMSAHLRQLRPLDEPADEPLEHGVKQTARVEGREPAIGVFIELLERLDPEAVAKEKPARACAERLEAVGRRGAAVAATGIEERAGGRHEAVVRREDGRSPRGEGGLAVGQMLAVGRERGLHRCGRGIRPERGEPPLRLIEGEIGRGRDEGFGGPERAQKLVDGDERIAHGLRVERHEGRRRKHLRIVGDVAAGEAEPHFATKPRKQAPPMLERAGGGIAGHREPSLGPCGVQEGAVAIGEHRVGRTAAGKPVFIEPDDKRKWPAGVAAPGEAAHVEAARPRP